MSYTAPWENRYPLPNELPGWNLGESRLHGGKSDCPVANLPQEILSEIIHHLSKTNMGSLYSVCFGLTCKSIYALHWKKYGKINIYPYDYMADIGGSPIDPLFTSWFAKQGYSRAGVQSKFEPRDSKERKVKRLLSRIF